MPDLLFWLVVILLIVSVIAVASRERGVELPDEDQTLDTLGPDDR